MTTLNLDDARAMADNHGGKVGATIAALCDEVEQLRKPRPAPSGSLNMLAIRRMADSSVSIPPWVLRALCDRHERLLAVACAWDDAIDRCDGVATAEEQLRAVLRELR